tara:strand:+ start:1241 stop:1549 length:309 start_codon:yes stop_codon:yes gene_type:complete
MNENNTIIENNCGQSSNNDELIEIGNDPNFVFENDPTFNTVVLYDLDGNVVNVNSWLECAHYVNGGWTTSFSNFDGNLFFLIFVSSSFLLYFLSKKIFSFKL